MVKFVTENYIKFSRKTKYHVFVKQKNCKDRNFDFSTDSNIQFDTYLEVKSDNKVDGYSRTRSLFLYIDIFEMAKRETEIEKK